MEISGNTILGAIAIAFMLGWLATISSVIIGGWLVFRTKREGYDNLFGKEPKGEAFQLTDELDLSKSIQKSSARIPNITEETQNAFVEQMMNDIEAKESKK